VSANGKSVVIDEKKLLVDEPPCPLSEGWSLAGALLLSAIAMASPFLPDIVFPGLAVAFMFLLLTARLSGQILPPRKHPAAPYVFLAAVAPIPTLLAGHRGPDQYPGFLLALVIVWLAVWLVRTSKSLVIVTWGVLLAGGLFAFNAWNRFYGPGSTFEIGQNGLALLVVVVGYLAWLLTNYGLLRIAAALLLLLAASGLFVPDNVRSIAERSQTIALPTNTTAWLFLLFLLFSAFHVFRSVLKESRRWRKRSSGRALMVSMAPLSILLLYFATTTPPDRGLAAWVMLGMMFGLGLASRERLVYEDPTRHPRSRPGPWWTPLEELWIALRSISASLGTLVHKEVIQDSEPALRILDAAGESVCCPYESGDPVWVPIVMHMHSNRWEGAFSAVEVFNHYAKIGAGSVILTDHNRITSVEHLVAGPPAYEHGWGPHNHHILVLGAEKTLVDRHPFGGNTASRAETLARLKNVSLFRVLAHPKSGEAWTESDVTSLDYEAVEVFNKSSDETVSWDAALSSGLLVWGTAGDDCHDLRSRHQTGKRYLLADMRGLPGITDGIPPTPDQVLDALIAGRFVSVLLAEHPSERRITRHLPEPDAPVIESFQKKGDGLEVRFVSPVDVVRIVGDGGVVLKEKANADRCEISIPSNGSYARLEVQHGFHTLVMNPLVKLRQGCTMPGSRD